MTRRSTPMMRSRLRNPTSKSIAMVFLPSSAIPVAMLALVVVLPTPPLPDVTTTILDTGGLLSVVIRPAESNKRQARTAGKFFARFFFRVRRFYSAATRTAPCSTKIWAGLPRSFCGMSSAVRNSPPTETSSASRLWQKTRVSVCPCAPARARPMRRP